MLRAEQRLVSDPYFSICVPQHNRTSFFLKACESFADQSFKDFEVCISDDGSTDGRQQEIIRFLQARGVSFVYQAQARNTGYDGNLRAAIALARGQYCFLMGNDDALSGPDALIKLRMAMDAESALGVVISDYEDFATGARAGRIRRTANYGGGPDVASRHFRNFSFVSGVVFERTRAQSLATDKWDGSEMYQTYIGCRMIAEGLPLLELSQSLVRKDIRIPNETVDSYALRKRISPCPLVERRLPLCLLARLVADAISPYLNDKDREAAFELILRKLWCFTYPFWILEYRRVQSWRYAAGVCLGMRPHVVAAGLPLGFARRCRLAVIYLLATLGGLTTPQWLFTVLRNPLYRWAKQS